MKFVLKSWVKLQSDVAGLKGSIKIQFTYYVFTCKMFADGSPLFEFAVM